MKHARKAVFIVLPVLAALTLTLTPGPARFAEAATNPVTATNGFLVDPDSVPATWVKAHPTDSRAATIQAAIADQPIAKWFTAGSGSIGPAVGAYVGRAQNAGKLPILVAYNLPGRDACGGQSAGGAPSDSAYHTWIAAFASAIGTRPALVVLEPDAFGDYSCMTAAQIADRNALLQFAVNQLTARATGTWTYLDAGNAGWIPAAQMAGYLRDAGVASVHGYAVNVSNYYSTSASISYAKQVDTALAMTKPFVIDTGRNGNGSNGEWCNPPGRKLGSTPQQGGGAEMLLWLKTVGASDGLCGIAPTTPAGTFDPALAMHLITGN